MRRERVVLASLVAMILGSCSSVQVKSECHQRISDCLARCPADNSVPASTPPGQFQAMDSRSPCEQNCESQCY